LQEYRRKVEKKKGLKERKYLASQVAFLMDPEIKKKEEE